MEERTARLGEAAVRLVESVPASPVRRPPVGQEVRAATSAGANYCEANYAESRKDFRHRIGLVRKESREAQHWLRMLVAAEPAARDEARKLWREAKELNLVFPTLFRNAAGRGKKAAEPPPETREGEPRRPQTKTTPELRIGRRATCGRRLPRSCFVFGN